MFNNYANFTDQTAVYEGANSGSREEFLYLSHGLVCEAGEVGNKIKCFFYDNPPERPGDRESILKECGQTLWYLTRLISALGSTPEHVIEKNVEEVKERMQNNEATQLVKRAFYTKDR